MRIAAALLGLLLLLPACATKTDEPQESLLRDKDRDFIRNTMEGMSQEMKLVLFTQEDDCDYCSLTEGFLRDAAELSPLLSLEVLSLSADGSRAAELGIDKAPGIAILGSEDHGIRYYGMPTGYEFTTFIDMIRMAAEGEPFLLEETTAALASLATPFTITVFSTKS